MVRFFIIGCLLFQAFFGQMPQTLYPFSDEVELSTTLDGTMATFYIVKKTGGFLAMGFGINMTKADIFMLEIKENKLVISNCQLVGFTRPTCGSQGEWKLIDYQIKTNGSWSAIVTRDISKISRVIIKPDNNFLIFNYSESPVLESGHNGYTNNQGVRIWNLAAGVASASITKVILFFLIKMLLLHQ